MKKRDNLITDLTEGSVFRQLLVFAGPLILANLLQTLYNLVDSFLVGRYINASALAAVTSAGQVINLTALIAMGLGAACQIIVSQYAGRHDMTGIKKMISATILIMGSLAVVLTIVFLTFYRTFLHWVNLPEETWAYAVDYYLICGTGIIFIFGYNAVSGILRGMGESKMPLLFVAISSILNFVLDLVFILACGMGTAGAALATVIGQGVSFIVSLVYLYRHKTALGFTGNMPLLKSDRESIRLFIKVGVPQATQNAALSISMLFILSLVNKYGMEASAVNGIAAKLEDICRMVANSLCTAGSAMVGQCMGAGKKQRCVSVTRCMFWISFIYCAVCALIVGFFPRRVFGVFTSDAAVLDLAETFAVVGAVTCMGHSLRNTFMMVVNGVGNAILSMVLLLLDGVVFRIGLSLLMGNALSMGLMGFWWGNSLAGYVPAVLGAWYYFSGKWKNYQLLKPSGKLE